MEIIDTFENHTTEKRSLKKIRKPFLNRNSPQSQTELVSLDNQGSNSTQEKVNVLHYCLGLVEVGGKLHASFGYLNSFVDQINFQVQDTSPQKLVTMNCNFLENSSKLYEESAQKLESYGCPDLLMWAERLRNYNKKHVEMMNDYYRLVTSSDTRKIANLRKAKTRAALVCREIENKYSNYSKVLSFSGQKSLDLLSISYNEGFLKELGHESAEEFIEWTKINGFQIFTHDCPTHLELSKGLFECSPFNVEETIVIGKEYDPLMFDRLGQNKNLKAQYIYVFEPTPQGFFISGYFVLNPEKQETVMTKDFVVEQQEEKLKNFEKNSSANRSYKSTQMSLENLD